MSWSNIQSTAQDDATQTGSSVSKAFAATVTAGSVVSGAVIWENDIPASLTSVTDDKGNSYTVADSVSDATNGEGVASFYATSFPNGLPTTITANFNVSTAFFGIIIKEDSPGAGFTISLDGHNGAIATAGFNVTGANLFSSGSATTTANGDLINGFAIGTGGAPSFTAGTSPNAFTARTNIPNNGAGTNFGMLSEDFVQTTAGSIAATAGNSSSTAGNSACGIFMLAFKAVASGDVLMPQIWL